MVSVVSWRKICRMQVNQLLKKRWRCSPVSTWHGCLKKNTTAIDLLESVLSRNVLGLLVGGGGGGGLPRPAAPILICITYCHCMRYQSDSTWIRRHLLQKSFHNNFAKLVLLTLLLLPWYANRQGGEDLNWRWWHMGLCASFSCYIWSFSHHCPRTNNSFNNSLLRPRWEVQVSSFWAPLGLC